jgi:CPA1 family monovalent cation:H+ antiporter
MKGNWKFLFMSIIGLFMIGLSYGQTNDDQAAIDEQVTNLEQNVETSKQVMSELEQEETVEDVITAEPIGEHSKEAVEEEGHTSHGHEGMNTLDLIALLVLLAALFTFINIHYIKLPGTIGLMLQALFLSLAIVGAGFIFPSIREGAENIMRNVDFTEVLLNIMLSFLLYAGALHVDIDKLKEESASVVVLAIFGTLMSTFLIATAIYYFLGLFELGFEIEYIHCLLLGALISPTDPIAVLAILKTTNISKNLQIKIEGESLFNDGIGVVVFITILAIASGGSSHGGGEEVTAGSVAFLFGKEVFGGLLLGGVFGAFGYWLLVVIDNAHEELEVLTTLALVLVGTQIAVHLHISAPLAMVVMGLIVGRGNSTAGQLDENGVEIEGIAGEYVMKFWHLVDEAMNAILFILIGLEMLIIIEESTGAFLQIGVISIFIILAGRFLGVAIPVTILDFFKRSATGTIPILTWGGLRGGISIALALSLSNADLGGEVDGKQIKYLIVTITYCVVVFSILVQGMTIEKLVKKYL